MRPRQRGVIALHYGLKDGLNRTLEEIGREWGVTRETIRTIEAKALRILRHPSNSKHLKGYLGYGNTRGLSREGTAEEIQIREPKVHIDQGEEGYLSSIPLGIKYRIEEILRDPNYSPPPGRVFRYVVKEYAKAFPDKMVIKGLDATNRDMTEKIAIALGVIDKIRQDELVAAQQEDLGEE